MRDLRDAGVPVGLGVDGAGVERGGQPARGGAARGALRPGPRRARRADRARRRWRWRPSVAPGCSAATARRGRWSRASSPTWPCGGSTRCRTRASATRWPPSCSASPPPLELLLVGGRAVVEQDRLLTVDEDAAGPRRRDRRAHPARPGGVVSVTGGAPTRTREQGGVGTDAARPDGTLKVTGEFAYGSDLWMDDMLWGATLRSPHPHARVRSVDIGAALAVPGVYAVLTSEDVPGEAALRAGAPRPAGAGAGHRALPGRAGGAGRRGPSRDGPARGARIVVDYEVLEPVTDAREALGHGRRRCTGAAASRSRHLRPGGNLIRHLKIRKGDPSARRPRSSSPASTRSACRTRPSSGPSPGWPCRPRTAGSTSTCRPSGCTSTRSRCAVPSGCRRRRCGSRSRASAARSAGARTCRCTCTPACWRCAPASR